MKPKNLSWGGGGGVGDVWKNTILRQFFHYSLSSEVLNMDPLVYRGLNVLWPIKRLTTAVAIQVPQSSKVSTFTAARALLRSGTRKSQRFSTCKQMIGGRGEKENQLQISILSKIESFQEYTMGGGGGGYMSSSKKL